MKVATNKTIAIGPMENWPDATMPATRTSATTPEANNSVYGNVLEDLFCPIHCLFKIYTAKLLTFYKMSAADFLIYGTVIVTVHNFDNLFG